jgi:hypothetical protein
VAEQVTVNHLVAGSIPARAAISLNEMRDYGNLEKFCLDTTSTLLGSYSMPYPATVFRVMIASPGDVKEERLVAQEVIADWNSVHAENDRIVLLPLLWERDSTPLQGERAQALINEQVLEKADLLVAIFWTRIGSPTGVAPTGTVEELREHLAANKPALLYFSRAPLPADVDTDQLKAVRDFQKDAETKGLYQTFSSKDDFRQKFARHLGSVVVGHGAFRTVRSAAGAASLAPTPAVSDKARTILKHASSKDGQIVITQRIGEHPGVESSGRAFADNKNARSSAEWVSAVKELARFGYAEQASENVYRVTAEGYQLADTLTDVSP